MATATKMKVKPTLNMTLPAECISADRTDVVFRDKRLVIDEPVERGGTDQGLSPVEVCSASLLGCTNVIANKVAKMHGVELRDMRIEADFTFDRRGAMLIEEVDTPWTAVTIRIHAVSDADEDALAKVKRDLPRFCPVSKLFQQAGARVEEDWRVTRG